MAANEPEKPSEPSMRERDVSPRGEIPTFLGLSDRPLRLLVSVVATTGFLLFGYDRELQPAYPFPIRQ